MSQTNYTPFSTAPISQVGASPIMEGLRSVRADEMLRRAQELGLEGMLTGNQQARANLDRYQAQTPNEIAISNYAGAQAAARNNPQFIQSGVGAERAKNDKIESDTRIQLGTEPSTIASTNANNRLQELTSRVVRINAMAEQSPMMAQAEWKDLFKDSPIGQMFPGYTPEVGQRVIKMLAQNVQHTQNQQIHDADNASRERIAAENRRAAEARAAAAKKAAKSAIEQFWAAKNAEKLSMGAYLLANPDIDDVEKGKIKAAMDAAARERAESRDRFDMANPGASAEDQARDVARRLNPGNEPQAQHTLSQLRAIYPGKSDAEIQEAYRRRFGATPR